MILCSEKGSLHFFLTEKDNELHDPDDTALHDDGGVQLRLALHTAGSGLTVYYIGYLICGFHFCHLSMLMLVTLPSYR